MVVEENHELTRTQEDAVQYMLRHESDGAALLAFDMGLGKTRTGLMFVRESGHKVVVVAAPLQTLDSWAKTASVEVPDLPVYRIENTASGRKALADFQWRLPGIYLVGHEYWERLAWVKQEFKTRRKVKDPKTGKLVPEVKTRKVDSGVWSKPGYILLFDESHRSSNHESWTHKALLNVKADFKLAMSGTFFGDRFDGAYGATKWLWPHRTDIIHQDIYAWRARWAKTVYDRFAPRNQRVVGELEEGAFVSALPCYIRVENEMPAPIKHNIWVDLYDEQRRVYDELDTRMVAWINDQPLATKLPITQRARQRQATLAMPSLTYDGNELIDVSFEEDALSVKIDRLLELLDNELVTEQVLILTDSQKFASILTKRLNNALGENTAREWSGQVKRNVRAQIKDDFLRGLVRCIVGVQAAMGTGTDGLQHASNNLVFMSRSDRRIDNDQAIGRLNRTGQTKEVHVWSILARDTIDTGQLSKQVQAAIKAKKSMRRKS